MPVCDKTDFRLRAFISHSSKDKKFVRTLKEGLQLNSISTWIDEDEIDFGDSLLEKLDSILLHT